MNAIPAEFFEEMWQKADHPMAAVDTESRFVKVNRAFEALLGYSESEMRGRTWMEFTRHEHVGGDLQSVQDIIDGRIESYRLEKDYRHKRGHYVSIVLYVRKFPPEIVKPLALFAVEAPLASSRRQDFDDIEKHTLEAIAQIRKEFEEYQKGVNIHVGTNVTGGDHVEGPKVGGDLVGNDKNSDKAIQTLIRFIAAVLIVLVMIVAWVVYYVTTMDNGQMPQAPPSPNVTVEAGEGVP